MPSLARLVPTGVPSPCQFIGQVLKLVEADEQLGNSRNAHDRFGLYFHVLAAAQVSVRST
jgi:hypothetical protein